MSLAALRSTAEEAGAMLDRAAAVLARIEPGSGLSRMPGALGDLGRDVHDAMAAALTARSREAVAHAARFAEVARLLRTVAAGYAQTDAQVRQRHQEGER